jgi:hypothetical protein
MGFPFYKPIGLEQQACQPADYGILAIQRARVVGSEADCTVRAGQILQIAGTS